MISGQWSVVSGQWLLQVNGRGDGMKKEQPQNAEDNNQLDDNENPQLLPPRHPAEAIPIKTNDFL